MANVLGRQYPDRGDSAEDAVVQQDVAVPAWHGVNGTAVLSVSRQIYPRKAVLATAYKLSDRYAVLIDAEEEDRWTLYVLGSPDADPVQVVKVLIKELVDQALRVQLEEEFGAVRTLIVAQAFSEGNLLDSDQDAAAPDASIPPNRDGR